MFVDDLKTTRKICLAILLGVIQLIIIASFGAGWTSGNHWYKLFYGLPGMTAPYSTIIPYPSGAAWWYGLTAIVMYLLLFICAFYVLFTVAQVVFPDRIPFDLKMIVFIDVIFASIVTIMLLIAYAFFAGGYNGVTNIKLVGVGFGYCFWMAVASSIFSCSVVIISGLSWYRNN